MLIKFFLQKTKQNQIRKIIIFNPHSDLSKITCFKGLNMKH